MIQRILVLILISVLTGCTSLLPPDQAQKLPEAAKIEWHQSFKEAVDSASSQSKPMMLVFYGVSSRRLDERAFSDPDVIKLAQEFACLKIGADQGDLNRKYKVVEFPTFVFADPNGGEYDRFVGYKSQSSFVEMLKTALIPVEAEYTFRLDSSRPKLASVKCVFRNVRGRSLDLVLREKHDKISNISYSSSDGRPGWDEVDENIWKMKFNTDLLKTATVEYDVSLNIISDTSYTPEYATYLGDDYGVMDSRALFLAPQELYTTGEVAVRLDLPDGWPAITPWKEISQYSYSAASLEEVLGSFFCIGKFRFAKRQMGEHEIYAVHCGPEEQSPDLEEKVDRILQVFEDYTKRFDDFPFKKYLGVFVGPIPDGKYFRGSAHELGFAGPVNADNSFIAHEVFHAWNGGVVTQKSHYEGWFKEGFTQYYGYLTPYRLGYYSKERFLYYLTRDYEAYLKKYGTEGDMALTRVKEELARQEGHQQPESIRLWIMYYKGALVAHLMDSEIKKRTNGEKTLDGLMRYMFQEFRGRKYSSEDILKALNSLTGQDFSQFFSDFVYGKTKLPEITESME